ncbi:MAG: hypothetical protein KR126chlam3_00666 [Chlamydiae bacterium]|nr:hypothetical protein [Chlamydiota bacterium]
MQITGFFTSLSKISIISYIVAAVLSVAAIVMFVASRSQIPTQGIEEKGNPDRTADHSGAGVLPYCIRDNEVYFLLSNEGFGSAKRTWCDFGGGKDKGESPLQTAARECWEESRGILGDRKTIEQNISSSPVIGQRYKMFFLRVDASERITNADFISKKFRDHHRMEKTQIAWVKTSDVFAAVRNRKPFSLESSEEKLRGFFAKTIHDALKTPPEKAILDQICQITPPLAKAG